MKEFLAGIIASLMGMQTLAFGLVMWTLLTLRPLLGPGGLLGDEGRFIMGCGVKCLF